AARAVTALAIDTFGQVVGIDRVAPGSIVAWRDIRIAIMVKHALVGNEAPGPRMIGVGTRRHAPMTGSLRSKPGLRPFRIPAERQFDQRSPGCAMQIGSGMITRTHDVIN